MSLARTTTQLASVIVTKLGDSGGTLRRDVESELDNVIAWAKSSPRCIHRNTATTNSSGVGPDVLHTFSLPANSLQTDGDYLSVWYAGGFAGVNRDKFVQAQFDNQDYEPGGVFDFDGSTGWLINTRIIRTSVTAVRISHLWLANLLSINSANAASSQNIGGFTITRNGSLTVANLNSNAITMRVRSVVAAGAAAADVFQNLSIIELTQQ